MLWLNGLNGKGGKGQLWVVMQRSSNDSHFDTTCTGMVVMWWQTSNDGEWRCRAIQDLSTIDGMMPFVISGDDVVRWWTSLMDLQGSKHLYWLVPITINWGDDVDAVKNDDMMVCYLVYVSISFLLILAFEEPVSPSDALLFLAFWSVPPRYHLPMTHNAICFAFTLNFSIRAHWVVPSVNIFRILYVNVVAINWLGLFILSFLSLGASWFGTIVNCTCLPLSSGMSTLCFDTASVSKKADVVFSWILGLIVTFITIMSWFGSSTFSSDDIQLHALTILLCATCRSSKIPTSKSFWL